MAGNGKANSDYLRGSSVSVPCKNYLTGWGGKINPDGLSLDNRVIGGADIPFTDSNCLYYNGTTSKSEETFTNDILMYADKVEINYSVLGVVFTKWVTGNAAINGLFENNTTTRKFTIGNDGTLYYTGYVAEVVLYWNNNGTYVPFLKYGNASGSNVREENSLTNEADWKDRLFPFGEIRGEVNILGELTI